MRQVMLERKNKRTISWKKLYFIVKLCRKTIYAILIVVTRASD